MGLIPPGAAESREEGGLQRKLSRGRIVRTVEDGIPGERQSGQKKTVWLVLHSRLWGREPRAGVLGTIIALMSTPRRKVQPPLPGDTTPRTLIVCTDNDGWRRRHVARENRLKGHS